MTVGHRPTRAEIEAARLVLAPWRWMTAPCFEGLEHVPADRPFLLAGNHTLMGVLDAPLMVLGLHERRGVFVRALGDHLHFRVPVWRDLLARFGVVDGTPEVVHALMGERESILVFPGGAREVFKRKGEKYRLLWGDRMGFAHLAIEHGYSIVPFSAVGAEDAFDILIDADGLWRRRSGRSSVSSHLVPMSSRRSCAGSARPCCRGPSASTFASCPPSRRSGSPARQDEQVCFALREQVRLAIEAGITALLVERERDPDRALLPRMIDRFGRRRRTRA